VATKRPFRFGIQARTTGPREAWLEAVRRVEALGYDAMMWPDHFLRGLDPVAALAAAAIATTRLRLAGFVFDNDFRHPVVLAMAAGSIDVLSGGRLELGIGAGWLKEEYDQSGIPFDSPGLRIDRMTEAVRLIKRLLSEERVTHAGDFYAVTDLTLPPRPVQQPHPPIIIGGGSKRILSVAAREADIVGITTRALADGTKDTTDMTADATARKIEWVREAAGDRFADLELNIICPTVVVTDDRGGTAERLAGDFRVIPDELLDAPPALIGSIDQIVETLERRRERYGFSYVVVLETVMEQFAPVVERLAGR
jgi:probable F420-dependent oxidoreductase